MSVDGMSLDADGVPAATGQAVGVAIGDELPPRTVRLTRTDLVRYAAASGDLNPIHHSDHAARAAGLPGVVAHGMLTMGLAAALVTDWAGADSLESFRVRFTRPVLVPDDGVGAELVLSGVVAELTGGSVRVDVTARARSAGGEQVTVLGQARAVVRLTRTAAAPGPGPGRSAAP